jgi:dipeptidyl-peptidase-4
MIRKHRCIAAFAGALLVASTLEFAGAQSAHDLAGQQRGLEPPKDQRRFSAVLTPERIGAEPDVSLDVAHEPDPLRWSTDGVRVAWMQLLRPGPKALDVSPQEEVWTYDLKSSGGAGSQLKAVLLIASAKVTAALGGSDKPQTPTLDDDDDSGTDPLLLKDIAWSPDHTHLLLSGTTSLAWFDASAGTSRLLVKGDDLIFDAAISPDGRTVSFVREHKLCLVATAGGPVRTFAASGKADLLEGELDWPYRNSIHLARGYEWSPDSKSIAYFQIDDRKVAKYSLRSSHGELREIVFPKTNGELPVVHVFVKAVDGSPAVAREIELGETKNFYLPLMRWLPDGRQLAIERLDRRQRTLELYLADAITGRAKVILTEKDDYWINLAEDVTFLKDSKRFVWSSERATGFRHLYLYDTQGRQVAQLTRGDWAVMRVNAVDEAKGVVYFTATEKSPLERHLYKVGVDGTGITRITQAAGTHSASIAPPMGSFIDTYSNLATMPKQEVVSLDGSGAVIGTTANVADAVGMPKLQPVEVVDLKMHLGAKTQAFLIKPPAFDATKKYPVIVYMAGGPGEQLVRDRWMGATGLWMHLMAQKGYVVFALDNQATGARGHYFEEPIHLRLGGQEMADQRDGLLYLATLPYVDASRIGACGWGYGGFLAVHAILDRPVPYKAAFAGAPVVDWHFYDTIYAERYLDDPVIHADGWDASKATENDSPVFFKGALMLAQGTEDESVHIENLLTLQDKLLDQGKSADILLFPDRGHALEDPGSRTVLFTRMTDFFVKNL